MMTGGARRCSHCGNSGHNSRTCNERKGSLKLFGVRILAEEMDKDHHHHQFQDENVPLKKERNEAMQRSLSMGNLVYQQHLNNPHVLNEINKYTIMNIGDNADHDHDVHGDDGYLSDGLTQYSSCKPKILRWKKKGIPWTEEEHKTFLIGLKTLGRGDWRGISKNFVHTRTPMQVASHAQKYFMRQLSAKDMKKKKKNRRMSLFDLSLIGDLSLNSPTTPFASPIEESPPRQVENFINSYGSSSDHADLNASTFHARHSHALPPLSPQGQVFKGLPDTGCLRIDVPKMANYALNEDLLKLSLLNSVSPRQADDTRLQLGLPSFESPKIGLMSSMVDDMVELRIALPVGLYSPSKLVPLPL